MALNGRVSVEATPNGQDLLVFSWSAVQDAAANTSTVSWMMQLVASTAGAINGVPVERDWSVTVDGQEFTGTANVNISNNETKTLATGEIVLEHTQDGTRSFAFAFSQDLSITWGASSGNPQFIGTVSGSGTGELDTIAEPEPKKFDIKGFMIGLAMGLCGRPVQWPKREPVAWLYNGVRLPDIYTVYTPELQAEYPHALIIHYPYDDGTSLSLLQVFSTPFVTVDYTEKYGYVSVQVEDGGAYMEWQYQSDEYTDWMGSNIPITSDTWETRTTKILWSNTTIYNPDGTVYMEASDPVPVYE